MVKRFLVLIITLSLLMPVSFSAHGQPVAATLANTSPFVAAQLNLLSSDEHGVVLSLVVPYGSWVTESGSSGGFLHLSIPGAGSTSEVGKPETPTFSALIGVPPTAQVELRVVSDTAISLPGQFDLSPVPRPVSVADDAQSASLVYEKDADAYATDALYPSMSARVASDAWLRDQRVVSIELNPIQYNPANGHLLWHPRLQVEVRFVGSTDPAVSTPVEPEDPFDAILQAYIMNYTEARQWRSIPSGVIQNPRPSLNEQASLGPRYKITVDHDGLYRLTYTDLEKAGMDVDTINPQDFYLTSQGQDVAIYVTGEGDGSFDISDEIYFYGEKFRGDDMSQWYASERDNWITYTQTLSNGMPVDWHPRVTRYLLEQYTDDNVYWLRLTSPGGPRMATVNGDPAGSSASIPATDRVTIHAEQQLTRRERTWTGEDAWFWELVQNTATHAYPTSLIGLPSGVYTATVRGEVVGWTANDYVFQDHHIRLNLNDLVTPVKDAYFEGISRYRFEVQVPQTALVEGTNQLKLAQVNIPNPAGPPTNIVQQVYFDWYEIEYSRLFKADQNQFSFSGDTTGTWRYQVGSLTTNTISVYDVTDPLSPVRLLNPAVTGSGVYTVTFAANHAAGEQYLVLGGDQIQTPKKISYYDPPDLLSSTNGADYVIITHPDFLTVTQQLADYRSSSLRTVVINIDDLYNEFGEGIYHPQVIKTFLAYTFAHWTAPAPKYVVLVGDGHWNFKNAPSYMTSKIYLPPNLAWVDPWQGELDSTNLLGMVVGTDALPDVFMARIPVNSPGEFQTVYDKIVAYEGSSQQDWQRRLMFIADNTPDPAGDFRAISEGIINDYVPSSYQVDRIYETDICGANNPDGSHWYTACPAATHAITETINITGVLLVNFVGHAYGQGWAYGSGLFDNVDASKLTNADRLPVFISMTCLDGYWSWPEARANPSLGEVLLRKSDGGAVGLFAPGGLGVAHGHDTLHRGFLKSLFVNRNWQLGQAAMSGYAAIYQAGTNIDLIYTYQILGDPALNILHTEGLPIFLPMIMR